MATDAHRRPGPWLAATAAATVATLAAVTATGDWGQLPHYGAVLVGLVLLSAGSLTAWFGHRENTPLVAAWFAAFTMYVVQIAVGGLVQLADGASWASTVHIVLGGIAMVLAVLATVQTVAGPRRSGAPSLGLEHWRDYITLTKPRIMSLLLLTAVGGMFVGARGVPDLTVLLAMVGGLALACGGASALNHVLDRDIDVHMKRTDKRPVATGRIDASRALEFGLALSAFSFVVLASFTNILTATLAIFGNLFYVVVYTRWLKRSTPQNIVIGGAAGAVPPVVGYAAATGNLALPALFLFLIVFVWTPPHFWALALLIKREYAAAGVPMLPVVRGDSETARSIVRYSVAMVLVTLLPVLTGTLTWLYLAVAVVLGGAFLWLAVRLLEQLTRDRSKRLFTFSLAYLALLFVAMAIDPIVLA
ncbi:MAG: heme o synthase [Gaiellaceae bacterium]